jgi:hypothetical protein
MASTSDRRRRGRCKGKGGAVYQPRTPHLRSSVKHRPVSPSELYHPAFPLAPTIAVPHLPPRRTAIPAAVGVIQQPSSVWSPHTVQDVGQDSVHIAIVGTVTSPATRKSKLESRIAIQLSQQVTSRTTLQYDTLTSSRKTANLSIRIAPLSPNPTSLT